MKTEKSEGQPWRMIIWIVLCVGIVSGGLAIAFVLIKLGPKAPKIAPEVVLSSVRVVQVEQGDIQVEVVAQGNVEAERATQLVAQVGGRVIEVSPRFEAGEIFKKHETLLQIDPTDYQAALANAQASLEDAKLAKALEKASAEKAIRDWERLGNGNAPSDLVLRKPQLTSAEARVVAAQAGVDKALADLDRAQVVAPYDCRIEVKYLDEGATLAPGSPIANVISVGRWKCVCHFPWRITDFWRNPMTECLAER